MYRKGVLTLAEIGTASFVFLLFSSGIGLGLLSAGVIIWVFLTVVTFLVLLLPLTPELRSRILDWLFWTHGIRTGFFGSCAICTGIVIQIVVWILFSSSECGTPFTVMLQSHWFSSSLSLLAGMGLGILIGLLTGFPKSEQTRPRSKSR